LLPQFAFCLSCGKHYGLKKKESQPRLKPQALARMVIDIDKIESSPAERVTIASEVRREKEFQHLKNQSSSISDTSFTYGIDPKLTISTENRNIELWIMIKGETLKKSSPPSSKVWNLDP